jgi:hypothetical protein
MPHTDSGANKQAQVDSTNAAYNSMVAKWKLVRTLDAGTWAMRAAGEEFLPQFEAEEHRDWERRRDRSVLFNAFRRSANSLTGKVFARDVMLDEDVPPRLFEMADNIDLGGNNFSVFAKRFFRDGLVSGLGYILVDFPTQTNVRTLRDERESGARPYFVHIKPEDLIAGRSIIQNGKEIWTHARIRENTFEPDPGSEFGDVRVFRIRVFDRTEAGVFFRVFRKRNQEWVLETEPTLISVPVIPIEAWYTDKTGFMTSNLVLEDLAHKNVEHWQSASDQRNILTKTRFPMLSMTGVNEAENEDDEGTVIAPSSVLASANEGARFGWVEPQGRGIQAGRQDLEDLKLEMQLLAMEPLMTRPGNVTATEKAIDTAEANCTLQTLAAGLKDTLENALDIAGMYIGEAEGGSVDLNSNFGLNAADTKQLDTLIAMRNRGDISRETLWSEMKRRGVLDEDFKPDDEAERLQDEGAASLGAGFEDAEDELNEAAA